MKYYQTVIDKVVSEYPTSDQDKILGSAFRTDREDIFFEKKKKKKNNTETFQQKKLNQKKKQTVFFVKILFRVNFVFFSDILWFLILYFVLSFVVFTS